MVFAINDMGSNLHLRKLKEYNTHCYIFYVLCTQKKTRTAPENKSSGGLGSVNGSFISHKTFVVEVII